VPCKALTIAFHCLFHWRAPELMDLTSNVFDKLCTPQIGTNL